MTPKISSHRTSKIYTHTRRYEKERSHKHKRAEDIHRFKRMNFILIRVQKWQQETGKEVSQRQYNAMDIWMCRKEGAVLPCTVFVFILNNNAVFNSTNNNLSNSYFCHGVGPFSLCIVFSCVAIQKTGDHSVYALNWWKKKTLPSPSPSIRVLYFYTQHQQNETLFW